MTQQALAKAADENVQCEQCRVLVGGMPSHGGNLKPGGYTWVLVNELRRYACEGIGLRSLLDRGPEAVVREAPNPDPDVVRSLTLMRDYLTAHNDGRLVIGGKRFNYAGPMPGLLQEALLSLQAGQPLYLAAGFGGITLDIAGAVEADARSLLPARPADRALDAATLAALDAVRSIVAGAGWARLNNGLSADENRRLAATHRPAEIAAWVSLGLGRVAVQRLGAQPG